MLFSKEQTTLFTAAVARFREHFDHAPVRAELSDGQWYVIVDWSGSARDASERLDAFTDWWIEQPLVGFVFTYELVEPQPAAARLLNDPPLSETPAGLGLDPA